MNEAERKIELAQQVLQQRADILRDCLYVRKCYADDETRNFWEGKWSAYREAIDLLKSSNESISVEL